MTALTIAARELRDRSRLFLICAALGVLPFIAGMLPGARADRAGVITTTSSYLALALALGTAIAFGVSTVLRELVERRLSFYFSKPVSAAAIWIGKASASIVSSFRCFAIIAAPAALFVEGWPGPGLWMLEAPALLGITFLGVIVLFFVSHVLASVIRSRSALIGIDFAAAALLVFVLFLLARPLLVGGAMQLVINIGTGLFVVMLAVMAIAPVYQLERGRTDIRRSHAALSRFLWPAIFSAVAIAAGYVIWATRVTPDDLVQVQYMKQSPTSEEVMVAGLARGRGDYRVTFMLDGKGNWRRLGALAWTAVEFSRDGKTMAWLEPVGLIPSPRAILRTNRGNEAIPLLQFSDVALSDDGSRLAIGYGRNVAVHDTATGRLLASAASFDGGMRHSLYFVNRDVVRVLEYAWGAHAVPLRSFEFDVPRKKLTKTGEIRAPQIAALSASPDGSRLLLRKQRKVVDARTLATIAELPQGDASWSVILSDGRVADLVREKRQTRLRIIGGPEVLLPAPSAMIVGELPDGKLIVRGTQVVGWSATGAARTMFIVDPRSGQIVTKVDEVKGPELDWSDPRLPRYDVGRFAAVDKVGKVIWWDPRTGRAEHPPRKD